MKQTLDKFTVLPNSLRRELVTNLIKTVIAERFGSRAKRVRRSNYYFNTISAYVKMTETDRLLLKQSLEQQSLRELGYQSIVAVTKDDMTPNRLWVRYAIGNEAYNTTNADPVVRARWSLNLLIADAEATVRCETDRLTALYQKLSELT